MKLNKHFLLFTAILFMSLSSFAGDEICNGGDVVVCPNQPIQVLDIIERSALYGLSNHPLEGGMRRTRSYHVSYAIGEILRPLQTLNPDIYKCLSSYLENEQFWSELRFVSLAEFGDVKDEKAYVIPKGCEKKQAAMQFRTIKPYLGSRYLINNDLWLQMDDFQRAALLLHETILRNYILNPLWNGDTTSVRYLTGVLTSAEVAGMSPQEFKEVLEGVSFTCKMNN